MIEDKGQGKGYGNGMGNGRGYGSGDGVTKAIGGNGYTYIEPIVLSQGGNGIGIKYLNGHEVKNINGVPTIVTDKHTDYSKAYKLHHNIHLDPCFISECNGYIEHGKTMEEAAMAATLTYFRKIPLALRVEEFIKHYPDPNAVTTMKEFCVWHGRLTGSCEIGRSEFCFQNNLPPSKEVVVIEVLHAVRDAYMPDIINAVIECYKALRG